MAQDSRNSRLIAGRYLLGARIGRGGMGTVWRATDQLLGREVAVKELNPETGAATASALREARAVAQLKHPQVIVVHDVVEDDERPYIVMELVVGCSLADHLAEQGPVGPREAARIGVALLGALRAAHARGVLHRDIKPANVLLEGDGRVVLTDFGIARLAGATTISETGAFIGSPEYTSPERMQGADAGPASDLWSLGVLLCAVSSGVSPFHRDSLGGVLHAVVTDEIRLPAGAGPLLPVVLGLLDRDPARRMGADEAERLLAAQATVGEGGEHGTCAVSGAGAVPAAGAGQGTGAGAAPAAGAGPAVPGAVPSYAPGPRPVPAAAAPPRPAADVSALDTASAVPQTAPPVPSAAQPVPQPAPPAPSAAQPVPQSAQPVLSAAPPVPHAAQPVPHAAQPVPSAVPRAGSARPALRGAVLVAGVLVAAAAGAGIVLYAVGGTGAARTDGASAAHRSASAPPAAGPTATPGGDPQRTPHAATAPSPGPTGTRTRQASPASSGVPAGYRTADDSWGFSLAVPADAARSTDDKRVYYMTPGKVFRIGIRVHDSPGGGPMETQHASDAAGPRTNPGYRDSEVTATTHDGHDAALWEFTWNGYSTREGARHTYDLCWEQDGRLYDVWVSAPVGGLDTAKRHFDTAVGSFAAH
ncbi:protein kinase domain-containing protein [Streptomyces sp. NBC_00388]|uniref:protein kinase domain-containing protein n=1 Tax=Streptomyces sp. NBC_00388 TaxID=2975735 RepID=UPI002E1E3471